VNTAIWLADSPGKNLVILDNQGWYSDVTKIFIRQRQIQIAPCCQFYWNFLRIFFNNLTNFYKVLQDNLRNRWENVLRPVPSWITGLNNVLQTLPEILAWEACEGKKGQKNMVCLPANISNLPLHKHVLYLRNIFNF
jgi:hypothetical protein